MANVSATWTRVRFDAMVTSAGATRKARGWTAGTAGVDRYLGLEHLDVNSPKIRRWGSPDGVGENSDVRHFEPGDVILARRGIEQRKVGMAEFRGVASGHALVFRAQPEIMLPEFLPYFLLSDVFMNRALEFSAGSLSKTVNLSALMKQEFALPPLEAQRRIATAMHSFEAVRQALHDVAVAADAAYDAYASAAFRGEGRGHMTRHPRLGLVAASYKVVTVGDVIESSQYGLSTAPQEVGGYPILRMMNLVDGEVVENDIRYVDLHEKELAAYRLYPGDVLFNRTNSIDLVGRTGVYGLDGEHVFASYLVRLKVRGEAVRPKYLCAYLNAPLGRQQVLGFATKAVSQANVSASNLAKVLVPVPSVDVQNRIVAGLESLQSAAQNARTRTAMVADHSRLLMDRVMKEMRS